MAFGIGRLMNSSKLGVQGWGTLIVWWVIAGFFVAMLDLGADWFYDRGVWPLGACLRLKACIGGLGWLLFGLVIWIVLPVMYIKERLGR